MRKLDFIKVVVVGLVCAGAVLLDVRGAFAVEKSSGGDAQLIIGRSPTLGSGTSVAVMVDGKKVGSFGSGSKYKGSLTAGKHTLTIAFESAGGGEKPSTLEINAVAGETYSYLAAIRHGAIILTKTK